METHGSGAARVATQKSKAWCTERFPGEAAALQGRAAGFIAISKVIDFVAEQTLQDYDVYFANCRHFARSLYVYTVTAELYGLGSYLLWFGGESCGSLLLGSGGLCIYRRCVVVYRLGCVFQSGGVVAVSICLVDLSSCYEHSGWHVYECSNGAIFHGWWYFSRLVLLYTIAAMVRYTTSANELFIHGWCYPSLSTHLILFESGLASSFFFAGVWLPPR